MAVSFLYSFKVWLISSWFFLQENKLLIPYMSDTWVLAEMIERPLI